MLHCSLKLKFVVESQGFPWISNTADYLGDLVVSIRDVHCWLLRFGVKSYGKSSAFYREIACCLIDSSSAWMYMGVPGGTHVVPRRTYGSSYA